TGPPARWPSRPERWSRVARLDRERGELGVAREVAPRIRAGGDDAEPLRARVGECRLREVGRDLAPAQRGRREGVLQVEQIAAPFVDERRLRAVQSHDDAPRLVLDAHLHRPTLPAERTRGKTAQGGPRAIN